MDPEIWVLIAAVFVSGGAIGSTGTLLAQWLIRKLAPGGQPGVLPADDRGRLRAEVAELHRHLENMDARLDFTERLLDGALPTSPPPERLRPEIDAPVEISDAEASAPADDRPEP